MQNVPTKYSESNKYNKLINDVRIYLVNEFKIKLEEGILNHKWLK